MTKMIEVKHKGSKTSIKIVADDLPRLEDKGYKIVESKKPVAKKKAAEPEAESKE